MGKLSRFVEVGRSYSVMGLVRLGVDLGWTRLCFPGARLVRRPYIVRGRRHIRIGAGFTSGPGLRVDAFPLGSGDRVIINIGDGVQVNDSVHVAGVHSVRIGNRVLIASKVFITDHGHGSYGTDGGDSPLVPPAERPLSWAPVVIEDDVWLGEFCSVLPGVTIGKGSIIGTMSVVNRDVPPYCIAAGSPARVIKRYNFEARRWDRV